MDHVPIFISRPIPSHLERSDHITELLFKPILRPEHELANARMQTIGADYQIE